MARTPKQAGRSGWISSAILASATLVLCTGATGLARADSVDPGLPPPPPSAYLNQCEDNGAGSQEGYPETSPAGATDLFTSSFPCILDGLAADPATPTDNAQAASGVDLSLEPTGEGFAPADPLVDVTFPADLANEVALGDRGISIVMSASDPDASVGSAELPGGQGVFYADSAPATDVVLAPISIGLESVYQLRAPESPERLEMTLTLPDGASLQPAGDGGIEVEQGGHSIANVSQPQAVDATGNPVAAIMTADENSIELDVPHSDAEVAYPIAVTTMATAVGSSTNPKLGYNFIVRGDDAASNWKTAHDDGNATWARVAVGPGQVSAAKQALLVPLIQIGRPTTCDPAVDKYCKLLPGSASTYGDTCHDAASSYGGGYGTSFEVINEPNHPVGDGWSAKPLYPDAYATLFRACYNAIKSAKPEAPVLGGSVVRSFNPDLGPDGMDWAEYEYEFGSATFANGDRIRDLSYIVSSHLYPRTCLGSYADMDTCMGNWLGWDKALMGEANGDPRRAWVTEFGIKDGWKGCGTAGYKEFWLQHGFEFLGDTYDVPIVFVFRFTRNRPAFWLDPSLLIDSWGDSGVYDSTLNSGDPADGVNGYYGGHQSCGFTTLATAAANEPG